PFTANTTANSVFATASSLLQTAPNLRYRNGHTIVPGIVRPGTLLYHGREDSIIPATDWVAFDPEISYDFCRIFTPSGGCWHHTFTVVRPLRVLYFDGASHAKLGGGEMDSQDIITWGEIRPDRNWAAYHSEGIIYLRVLDRFISFYDEKLAPSLVAVRLDRPRLEHRLLGITEEDLVRMKKYLEEQVMETRWSSLEGVGNHLDWPTHLHSIIELYGETLEDIWNLLNPTASLAARSPTRRVKDAFQLVESLIQRFVLYNVSPPSGFDKNKTDVTWASSVFRECTLSHYMVIGTLSLTTSEQLLRDAVEGTTREICRVLTKMWAYGVHDGLSEIFHDRITSKRPREDSKKVDALLDIWKVDLGSLMKWLDWGVWLRCRPACKEQEQCYIPAWPFVVGNVSGTIWREDNPQPRCYVTSRCQCSKMIAYNIVHQKHNPSVFTMDPDEELPEFGVRTAFSVVPMIVIDNDSPAHPMSFSWTFAESELLFFPSFHHVSEADLKGSTAANQYPLPTIYQSVSDDWDLNKPFTANTTVNFVFATASSLLQAAPNLRYRNGHTIVPGIVRPGTLLYHGRGDSIIPTTDWVAFNPEISHGFCRFLGLLEGSCWHHTFAVVRPLRVLHFDGTGAAKLPNGEMDSQDIIAWGEIRPDLFHQEGLRIQKLCEWGKPLGLDGFVRMSSLFEMMLCNFSSVNLVSSQHLKSAPSKAFPPPLPPPNVPIKPVTINSEVLNFLRVLDRFSQYPGVMHTQLDLSHLVSLYDEKLAPSLVAIRSDKPRLKHRLLGITEEDLMRAKKHLEEQVMETRWSSLEAVEIIWTGPLTCIRSSSYTERRSRIFGIFDSCCTTSLLLVTWASSVFRECTLSHFWLSTPFRSPHHLKKADALLDTWKVDLGSLMKWLDWGVWLRCRPACKEQEQCFIHAWPFVVGNASGTIWHEDNPQPRCLRKLEPFTYADDIDEQ
ncbi:hypothetical protein BT96DRAFT_917611, partial [Gymnopus androsaceus JB14]